MKKIIMLLCAVAAAAIVGPVLGKAAKADAAKPAKVEAATSNRQCKGKTQDGARCKRKAVEGHDYCAQHLEQEKPYQCKAMTEDGKQCKRNAFPEKFFCKQHEGSKKLADPKQDIGQCRAFTDEGKRCSRKAAIGWKYCDQHRK